MSELKSESSRDMLVKEHIFIKKLKSSKDTVWKTDKDGHRVIIPSDKDITDLIVAIKSDKDLFKEYHAPLKSFFEKNFPGEKLPWGTTSRMFYGVNLLSRFAPMSFSRAHLTRIFDEVFGVPSGSGDPIQYVNKSGQSGLQHHSFRIANMPFYHLAVMETGNHKRLAYKVDGDHKDKILTTIEHRRRKLAIAQKALAEGTIDVGHRNPYGSDPSSKNLIAQVSSENRALRDKYIFDEFGDISAPAPKTLIAKREAYYSDEAMSEIFEAIVKKDGLDFLSDAAQKLLVEKLREKYGKDLSDFGS